MKEGHLIATWLTARSADILGLMAIPDRADRLRAAILMVRTPAWLAGTAGLVLVRVAVLSGS